MSHVNPVNGLARHQFPVALRFEHPTDVWKIIHSTYKKKEREKETEVSALKDKTKLILKKI